MSAEEILDETLKRLGNFAEPSPEHGDDVDCAIFEGVVDLYIWLEAQKERLRCGVGIVDV